MKWVRWFNCNIKIDIKINYINVLNKITKWEEIIYTKKTFIWVQMSLSRHAKPNRIMLKKCDIKEKLALLKM